jgi:hypothetical protein
MSAISRVLLVLGLCLLGPLTGCGSKRGAVSGVVTLDGQPVTNGMIAFVPIEGTQSPSSGASIGNGGRYAIGGEKGPMAGVFRVEIRAQRYTGKRIKLRDLPGQPFGPNAQGDMEETVEAVPAGYNSESKLRVEVHSGDNTLNFDLVSKPK